MSTQVKHTNHIQTAKVKDESFKIDNLQAYNLYLSFGEDTFEFCVIDTQSNKCILLEEYTLTGISSDNDLLAELNLIWENHHLLKAGFWKKVRVSFKNQQFTFIPNSLYSKENQKEYIDFFDGYEEGKHKIGTYKHLSFSGVNVFTYPKSIEDFLSKAYPKLKIEIVHQSSCLIEATFRGKTNKEDLTTLLSVEKNHLNLVITKKGELIFCNRFYFTSPEDFIYYVMLMYKELELDANENELLISGEIAPNSPLYDKIQKYIRHSTFGKRPKFLNFSYHFDEVFDHKFLNTYAIHLCE